VRSLTVALSAIALCSTLSAADRPNVLWITSEDNGQHLGCYGDAYSITPNLDALAAKGCRYTFCWSNAPVCAPARTTLITGMYPTSLGAEHMRSMVRMPAGMKLYPQYLREAGYYCTNNSKEDYNVEKPGQVWDESSARAHWKNRGTGQPFFAIFNHTISHESQIRNAIDAKDRIHDSAKVRIPAYHPDTPEVRKDWAQYYDRLTMMDARAGENLRELEAAGLADETIVFYYADHGSGMPRNKRWPYDSGLHVPLIVYFPEKWRHLATGDYQPGGTCGRLVSFVDFAPTLLSVCGVEPPEHMQGNAFLGPHAAGPQQYLHGFRGRMDERYDMVRSVTDGRYVYVRNYMPHRPYGQHVSYMFETPTTRVWKELFDAGKLNEAQSHFWKTKPAEELYDLRADRDEVVNLVASQEHRETVERFRGALVEHVRRIRDLGFFPEEHLHWFAKDGTLYDMVRDDDIYAASVFHHVAVNCTDPAGPGDRIGTYLRESSQFAPCEDLVLYWAVTGVLAQGGKHFEESRVALQEIVRGARRASASTTIVAAEALGRHGNDGEDRKLALDSLLEHANVERHRLYSAVLALNALDFLDGKAAPIKAEIARLPRTAANVPQRTGDYVTRLVEKTLADLE
jgi:uncharacterized sulfatase